MKTGNRSNALLVELLIVVMFFMLSCTVLLQVFWSVPPAVVTYFGPAKWIK